MGNRTLVAWVGATDWASMGNELGSQTKSQVEKAIGRSVRSSDDGGPIKSLLREERFDSIHLLNNYAKSLEPAFSKWLGKDISFYHPQKFKNPTDYSAIFHISDTFLTELFEDPTTRPTELCIHLSPGTPAMIAIWVLLGKSKYNARFYQSYQGENSVTEIPFDLDLHIRDVITKADAAFEHLRARSPDKSNGFSDMVGDSPALKEVIDRAACSAIRDVSVLLLGESGTGKSRIAQLIHNQSRRRDKPFESINCAAIPEQLLESELFGFKKNAFTDAKADKKGLFERADGGTIFLDEIGECGLALQSKLLSVLQPLNELGLCVRKIRPLGSLEEKTVDVRIIAATNQNLIQQVETKAFRLDLYYRLAAITIKLPPLRERKNDVLKLGNHFLAELNVNFSRDDRTFVPKSFSSDAIAFIRSHSWPGNARQLYNAILQAIVMTGRNKISRSDIEAAVETNPKENSLGFLLQDVELNKGFCLTKYLELIQKQLLQRGMDESQGNKRKAAELLGYTNWQTMDKQLRKLDIHFGR